jgi:hypothetical protein
VPSWSTRDGLVWGPGVGEDHDLRSRLERLASSAGDPPEHGLERVAARRHRRLHRRRGAVATAAVLAVFAAALALINPGPDQREQVTASETANPAATVGEVPRLVEVRCEPTGIVVPIASVRPERDGLHMRVVNPLGAPTRVDVEGDRWFSKPIDVPPGIKDVTVPVPPGVLTVGCEINGQFQRRRVDLVDPSGYYSEPELACDGSEQVRLYDLPIPSPTASLVAAARLALEDQLGDHIAAGAAKGYMSQALEDHSKDPVVEISVDDDAIAFAHVRGVDGSPDPPWVNIARVEVCQAAIVGEPTTTTSTTSTPEQPLPN